MIECAKNPKVGDIWVERVLIEICEVLAVSDKYVALKFTNKTKWPIMTRKEFVKFLTYSTKPNKTWCNCERKENA